MDLDDLNELLDQGFVAEAQICVVVDMHVVVEGHILQAELDVFVIE